MRQGVAHLGRQSTTACKTLLYGTLLPGPDIGRRCADIMRAVRDDGFEVGIHCWDHIRWQDGVAGRRCGLDADAR